jgi:CRISPR-associated protein Csb1
MDLESLKTEPRLLLETRLRPVQGTRFQPTGFPDLGGAEYEAGDGRKMLLVESAQSMANRLEAACWDEGAGDLVEALRGLPYVKAKVEKGVETSSILEAHRLNSPYIINSQEFARIEDEIGFEPKAPFDRRRLAKALFRYDPNSLIHGIFLEKVGGTVRLPRALSAFIEASDVSVAASGGVKFDRVQPATEDSSTPYGKADEGYGNVPYHRDEYTADRIVGYFNIDLALIRGFGLGQSAEALLIGLALFKVRRLLGHGLRLRTACDLDVIETAVTRPAGFVLPTLEELEAELPRLIEATSAQFVEPRVTEVTFVPNFKKKK